MSALLHRFPLHRHSMVETLARRLVRYEAARAAYFLRGEVNKIAATRVAKGIPAEIAAEQSAELESAVFCRLRTLHRYHGGDAA
jgi:hypothetical protein